MTLSNIYGLMSSNSSATPSATSTASLQEASTAGTASSVVSTASQPSTTAASLTETSLVKPPLAPTQTPTEAEVFYQLLARRRSIRKYKPDLPEKAVLDRILAAGLQSPSGKNRQNWRFFVVTGEKRERYLQYSQKSWNGIKDVLQQRLKPSLYAFTERFFFTLGDAPVIVFCYSHNTPEERYHTSIGSVYMAVENMNLACVAEGLGACTMGAPLEIKADVDQFLGVTELPEYKNGELELLCAVVMGFPDHQPPSPPRQIDGRITWLK